MRHLFEQFASAEGNWQNSAIMLNVRSKKRALATASTYGGSMKM